MYTNKKQIITNLLHEQRKKLNVCTPSDTPENELPAASSRNINKKQIITNILHEQRKKLDVCTPNDTAENEIPAASSRNINKKQIITNLLHDQRKKLNVCTPNDIPENELPAASSKNLNKKQIISDLLQKQRKNLYKVVTKSERILKKNTKRKRKIDNSGKVEESKRIRVQDDIESEDDLPLALRLTNLDKTKKSSQLPEITEENWKQFKTDLETKELNEKNIKIRRCLDRMQGHRMFELHFTALHFIRKAIVDSLLRRKWDNLVQLLIMMIKNYSDPVFTVFIRHLCDILKHYHPRIRGSDLEDQIDLIMEKYAEKKSELNELTTIV